MNVTAEKIRELEASAQSGNAEAQYMLGFVYSSGRGVEQDYSKSAEWDIKAAEQGHSKAEFSAGLMYYLERGVTKNYVQAKYWLDKSAENGNNDVLSFLKEINGVLAEQKAQEEKRKAEEEAAKRAEAERERFLAEVRAKQEKEAAVKRSRKKVLTWAAVMMAMFGLGALFFNNVENRAWFGFSEAQALLCSYYERGLEGYEKNPQQAVH